MTIDASQLTALLSAAETGDERALLSAAAHTVTALLGERGSAILVDGDARVVVSTHTPALTNWPVDLQRYPEIVLALDERRTVVIEDVRRDPLLASVRAQLPAALASVAVVPLVLGKQRLGVLTVQSGTRRTPAPGAVEAAGLIGRTAALLLDRLRLQSAGDQGIPARAPIEREVTLKLPIIGPRLVALPGPAPRRVLVVDDETDQLQLVRLMLEESGYIVETAENGAAGVQLARAGRPDLVLMDVNMPVLDGLSAAEQLHDDPETAAIPVLFLSAYDDLMARVRGLKLGAADFLAKPCFAPELLARIERAIEQSEFRRRVRSQTHVDELTGLGNLRALRDRLAVEQSRRERYGSATAMVMIDVDRLKQINDRLGHAVGSRVLAAIGVTLRATTRGSDLAVRYGGDEFVVVLPHTSREDAHRFAIRFLVRLGEVVVDGISPSVSVGVAALDAHEDGDLAGLLTRADDAAYRAKRAGGHRIQVHGKEAAGELLQAQE